ncbi:MAG: TldD protein, partial [Proteobacteria bacterium]
DDDGVPTCAFPIIERGLFVNYQTNREQPVFIGGETSRACAYSDSFCHVPIQRMPNISLRPGQRKLSLQDLIADTEDAILIKGDGSYSIDQQRSNFQFSGQEFWEVKDGCLGGMLRDVAYQGSTVSFWNSCDAICDESEYALAGSFYCGKGQPGQLAPVSHGSSPARFRGVNIINTKVR